MDLDFDKEIDALLRTMPKSDADFAGKDKHLDADEISAFAENALPERAKKRYAEHLADCDSCRKNLSELILLNNENEAEKVPQKEEVIAAAPVVIPWYRRLFAFPNLAYTMGALVLAFTGLTAFIVLQNFNAGNSEVAQANTNASAPANTSFESKPMMAANSNAATSENNSFANTNMAANTAIAETQASPEILGRDQTENKSEIPTNLPFDAKQLDEKRREADSDLAKLSDKETQADGATLSQAEESEPAAKNKTDDAIIAAAPPAQNPKPLATVKPPQPVRKKEVLTTRSGESVNDDAREDENNAALRSSSSRQISGKNFNRKNGVWYDSAYRNQPTINVRRNTNEYRNLDSGLRSIGNQLDGVVVVVWKAKAYRIE